MTTRVNNTANISDAERLVIEALWNNGDLTAEEVANRVANANDWSFTTVKTLLGRLMRKKAITAKRQGRRFVYRAKLTRQNYVKAQSRQFIDRLFAGRVAPLVSHFSETDQLTAEDVAALRRLLDELP